MTNTRLNTGMGTTDITRDGASLRDPGGYVFSYGGRIYRRLSGPAARHWLDFIATPLATRLMDDGRIVRTSIATDMDISNCVQLDAPSTDPDDGMVLMHERVPLITYAQEWSFSMLRDAAHLHLNLMSELLPSGWVLKDANPSNVQWLDGRLCLIDVASIEPYSAGPWRAYGQFCKTMLFPLLVSAHGQLPLQPILKGYGLEGMDAATAARHLPGRASFKPGVWTHVRLQSWLQKMADKSNSKRGVTGRELAASVGTTALIRMIDGLRRVLDAMPSPSPTSWTGYRLTSTYSEAQLRDKRETIERWCTDNMVRSDLAMDVGCNTGDYSELLAGHAGQVVSIDADMSCIDNLYQRHVPRVLPLVVDAAAPTPPAGWGLNEQRSFSERVQPDWSIWLAVIHHLAIHNGIRLDEVVRGIAGTSPWVIVEFVSPDDEMVRALLAVRDLERPDYTEVHFLSLLKTYRMQILDIRSITDTRTLYLLRREVVT